MSPKLDGYDVADLTIMAMKGDKDNTHMVELDEENDLTSILRHFGVVTHPTIQVAFARKIHLFAHIPSAQNKDQKMLVAISKIFKAKFDNLLHEHRLQESSIIFDLPSDGAASILAYFWGRSTEAGQANKCIKYLQTHIFLPDGVEYYHASSESDLLTMSLASSHLILKGTTDIVVTDKPYIDCRNVSSCMWILIELKKSVVRISLIVQAAAGLLAASAHSNFPMVLLLTDSRYLWQFEWLTKSEVVQVDCTVRRLKGSTLLKILAIGLVTSALEDKAISSALYEKRYTLHSIYGYKESSHEVEGLESVLIRSKVSLMDILLQGDIRNMTEVFDVMMIAKVVDWARSVTQRYLMNTPAGQSLITARDNLKWKSMYV